MPGMAHFYNICRKLKAAVLSKGSRCGTIDPVANSLFLSKYFQRMVENKFDSVQITL